MKNRVAQKLKNFILLIGFISILLVVLQGCQDRSGLAATGEDPTTEKDPTPNLTLKVGADIIPHSEILNFIKPELEKRGVHLEVVNLDDSGQLNPALAEGQLDANYFQHVPYLESVAKEKGYDFEVLANVHVEPIGLYSQKYKTFDTIEPGAVIAIPDNPSNEYRALVLLEANGLIKLREGLADYAATPADILENPKNLKFIEVDAGQLTRSLPDVDAAVINTNRILEAGIDPKTALILENANSPYGNIVAIRKGEANREALVKLKEVLLSDTVRTFIEETYGQAVVPAF